MALKLYKGSVRLGGGHSLIIGHAPHIATLTAETSRFNIEKFGLFNLATPDTATYYKEATASELKPKDEDYIRPLFRGLSEVIVRKNFDPIDFAKEAGVLKSSMGKMLGQTVYSNHEAFVGNEKGVVSDVMWDNAYQMEAFDDKGKPIKVPAGFNLEFMIDVKSHPKLVRDLQSEPPTVHSNSVTVQFGWMQSHPKMSFDDFRGKVGTYDDKGELVRRVVNEIFAYHETSFVSHGADPYAQMITKDGTIVNPKYAATRDSFAEAKHVTTFFAFDYKDSFSDLTIPKNVNTIENGDDPDKNNKPVKKKKMEIKLALLMASLAGVTIPEDQAKLSQEAFDEAFDEEAFTAQVLAKQTELAELPNLTTKLTALTAEVTTLTEEKTALELFKTENEPKLAELGEVDTFKAGLLSEVLKANAIVTGKDTSESLKATFEASNLKTLKAFKETFEEQLENKFPMECKSCGGHDVHRSTADADLEDKDKSKPLTGNALVNSFKQKNNVGNFHV